MGVSGPPFCVASRRNIGCGDGSFCDVAFRASIPEGDMGHGARVHQIVAGAGDARFTRVNEVRLANVSPRQVT